MILKDCTAVRISLVSNIFIQDNSSGCAKYVNHPNRSKWPTDTSRSSRTNSICAKNSPYWKLKLCFLMQDTVQNGLRIGKLHTENTCIFRKGMYKYRTHLFSWANRFVTAVLLAVSSEWKASSFSRYVFLLDITNARGAHYLPLFMDCFVVSFEISLASGTCFIWTEGKEVFFDFGNFCTCR